MDNLYIHCVTVPNGYALTIADRKYLYTSLGKLLIGAAWHIVHDNTDYADMEEIIEVMTSHKKIENLESVRHRFANLKGQITQLRNERTNLKEEIKELKNKLKTKKK